MRSIVETARNILYKPPCIMFEIMYEEFMDFGKMKLLHLRISTS